MLSDLFKLLDELRKKLLDLVYICPRGTREGMAYFFQEKCKSSIFGKNRHPVKHTKKIGNTKYHYLKWGTEKGGQWLDEDYFKVVTEDGEVSTMAATPVVSCGTRKSRDKRVKRHTVGLFVVAYPCGVVVVCNELFGSESISQVKITLLQPFHNLLN